MNTEDLWQKFTDPSLPVLPLLREDTDMSENRFGSSLMAPRRLREAMDKLEKHHPQIAGRLRTTWHREDEAWARGEELLPSEPVDDKVFEPIDAVYGGFAEPRTQAPEPPMWEQPRPPTMWERWRSWRQRF